MVGVAHGDYDDGHGGEGEGEDGHVDDGEGHVGIENHLVLLF
jgi:hypothetical protein